MRWLCRAQDLGRDRGVAAAYRFREGWSASYPETTGYIIETFFDYSDFSKNDEYRRRAFEMSAWLRSIQLADGSFQAGAVDAEPRPSVFNTGQILLGLVRAYEESGSHLELAAATRAGDWLVGVQDDDGAWRQFAYNGIPHVYYTRVAWALLQLHAVTGAEQYRKAAVRQLRWALAHQRPNGWFEGNSFDEESRPFTHTIVYAAEGLFGAGVLLEDDEFVDAADHVVTALARKFEVEKFLPGDLDEDWSSASRYTCLTGDAQLSALLIRLHLRGADERYLNTALKLNEYLRTTQDLESEHRAVRGGIKGSEPIWGDYLAYAYPNWPVKFFADALLLEERAIAVLERRFT